MTQEIKDNEAFAIAKSNLTTQLTAVVVTALLCVLWIAFAAIAAISSNIFGDVIYAIFFFISAAYLINRIGKLVDRYTTYMMMLVERRF